MKYLIKSMSVIIMTFIGLQALAQQPQVEMADVMRSNGKIYVVVAICLTILVGLFIYVWNIDRKISKIERKS